MNLLGWSLAGFLAGSVPTAYIIGRLLRGVDIRTLGSGNVGATNVFRTLGKGPGVVTLLIDIAKGLLPVLAARAWGVHPLAPVATGLAAVAGHTWTPFLCFKGGKGVATSAGVFLALLPWAALAAMGAFALAFALTKKVSVGSLSATVVLPSSAFSIYGATPASWLSLAIALLVAVKHTPNIRRLVRGEELGFGQRKEDPK